MRGGRVNLGKPIELLDDPFDCIHEIAASLDFARMSDSSYIVETTSLLA